MAAFSPRSILPVSFLLICTSPLMNPLLAQQQQPPSSPQTALPSLSCGWLGDRATFQAGDTATITVVIVPDLPSFPGATRRPSSLHFSVSLNGKRGNSTLVTDVAVRLDDGGGDPPARSSSSWNVTFVPLKAGDFVAVVAEERFGLGERSLPFTVTAAGVHPPASPVSWITSGDQQPVAGSRSLLSVIPKDAFGNAVARGTDMPAGGNGYFTISGSRVNGSGGAVDFLDFHYNGWTDDGRLSLDFVVTLAGNFLVHVFGNNTELRGSPLLLTVKPGPMDVSKSTCSWKHGTNFVQVFSRLEMFVHQRDTFGNIVPEIHPFDARIVDKATKFYVPVVDLSMEAVGDGVQLVTFNAVETGEYELTIFDAQLDQSFSIASCMFTVFVGFCNGSNSFANGSGLARSVAGSTSWFSVFLEDDYGIPSPINAEMLRVEISSKNGTTYAHPNVFPIGDRNEVIPTEGPSSFDLGPAAHQEIITENATVQASQFNVSYIPQIAGEYEIWVLCGNIGLNGGNPYAMQVLPGAVNMSLSSVLVSDHSRVKSLVQNEVTVRLLDSLMNPVASLESKLRFQIQLTYAYLPIPANTTAFVPGKFVDNRDGTYTAHYVATYLGSYDVCIQFEDKPLAPCPFCVDVLRDEYFSGVKNDSILVWEGESVSFDVLSNDNLEDSELQIVNSSSKPLHGSLLQFNQVFRYTPFEGFFGNDSFTYTISDGNNNVFTGMVFISVRCRPPQFISLPQKLHVTEDIMAPKFDGFPGFELVHSDTTEIISVTVKAQSGNVSLAPVPENLLQPSDYELSIGRRGREGKELILEGTVEAINDALQNLQYIGNEDFYGNDVVMLGAANRNGIEDAWFSIAVEPVNDPPIIRAPKSIFLAGKKSREGGYKILDENRDKFNFSIFEPDLRHYPGNKSDFLLELSLEVFEGTLTVTLPAGIISTVELKTEEDNCWLPLETYVTIANQFDLKGTGIRFLGKVQDCNNAMQNLFYNGPSHDTSLTITVNDLGNYGCYPDCSEMMTAPLIATKTVRLVKTPNHMNVNDVLKWVIAVQILLIACLTGVLLYYVLKCMKALKDDGRRYHGTDGATPAQTPRRQQMGAWKSVVDSSSSVGRVNRRRNNITAEISG